MGSRSRESHYQSGPLHAIRAISFLSNLVVTGVLVYFLLHLKSDSFKLPWTLLIIFATSALSLVYLLIGFCIHACSVFSPIFSLFCNIPLLVLWVGAFSLLTYNIYGTLSHSCSQANWSSDSSGLSTCNIYKAFYSFTLFAVLSQMALIVLDVRARRQQNRQGRYDKMGEPGSENLKMNLLDSSAHYAAPLDVPYNASVYPTDAPIHHGRDNFYESTDTSYRREDESTPTGRPAYLYDGRPGLYSRESSSGQLSRSDAPMLNNYGSRWAAEQTSYQPSRYDSPHR